MADQSKLNQIADAVSGWFAAPKPKKKPVQDPADGEEDNASKVQKSIVDATGGQ